MRKTPFIQRQPVACILGALLAVWLITLFVSTLPFLGFALHPFTLFGGEKSYLILFQNNYELRPTGGFISSFAILNQKNGVPSSMTFEDVYGSVDDHPFVEPPAPLGTLLAHESYQGHTLRDANFYPDFPHSAAEIEAFLHKTRPFQKIDGVVTIDVAFLERWLDAVGGVSIDGEDFTSVNLLDEVEQSVGDIDLHDLNARANRKGILKALFKKLAIKSALPWNSADVMRAFAGSFHDKHAQLFFKDPALQEKAESKGWAGRMQAPAGEDFLGVVDANYGGGKSNRYVKRSVYYSIDLEHGTATLDIRYDHPGDQYLPLSTNYTGYLRVYTPQDHSFPNSEFTGTDGGFSFGGSRVLVPVRSTKTLHYDVKLPPSTLDHLTYHLNLWKQPGIPGDYYYVSVRVPTGMKVDSDDFTPTENTAFYSGQLTDDMRLSLTLLKDDHPPRALTQDLTTLNQLDLWFNEPLNPDSASSDEVRITDTNTTNPSSDTIAVESVEASGNHLVIKTTGMTNQPQERFTLEISGISDYSANALKKRTYTFYQRLK